MSIGDLGATLRDDGRGAYTSATPGLIVAQETAFNFLLTDTPRELGPSADRISSEPPFASALHSARPVGFGNGPTDRLQSTEGSIISPSMFGFRR